MIIDVSWPISTTMTSYKNSKPISLNQTRFIEQNGMKEHEFSCNTHIGTHVDAPSHKLEHGKNLHEIPLTNLIGKALVIDVTHVTNSIQAADIKDISIEPNLIVLFKTKNSSLDDDQLFEPNFVYLSAEAATFLVSKKIKAVGIDYLGIERNSPTHETHSTLLQADIPIIEGLRLKNVEDGLYDFICLPINLMGVDAAPARAILVKKDFF